MATIIGIGFNHGRAYRLEDVPFLLILLLEPGRIFCEEKLHVLHICIF
jgi:hypothetical protein